MTAPLLVAMMGPPGSGKGTQCARLAAAFHAAHLSTGDLLRAEVQRESTVGVAIRAEIERGRLVGDDAVMALVTSAMERSRDRAILLDGFPRTIAQAEALDREYPGSLRHAIELVVPMPVLLRRLRARGRADDQPVVVRQRLVSYARETWPLLRWFASRGLLAHVDGSGPQDAVTSTLHTHLVHLGIRDAAVPV